MKLGLSLSGIILLVLLSGQNKPVICESFTFEPPNLKTVLFKETDLVTRCWSTYEVNLLLNRRIVQDLIPRKIPRDFPLVLKYLKSVEDIVTKMPSGINQTLVMSAVGDVIGGYLQAIVIPIANEAYYAGNVDYGTVADLHALLDKWKWFLSTDGSTWSQECDMHKIPTKVASLDLNLNDPDTACQELYVTASPASNETDYLSSETIIAETSRIAIPYLDNNLMPNAIALPFKKRNLYSLHDPDAAYILVKYYTLSMRCLSGNTNDLLAFNNFFHLWIASKVVPHLHDQDRWYPAFGAVMRVVETIKQKGLASTNTVFVPPLGDEHQDAALNSNLDSLGTVSDTKYSGKMANYFHIINSPYAFSIILLILFSIMFLVCGCLCCCLKCGSKRKHADIFFSSDSDTVLKNAVISLFCGLKDSLVTNGSKLEPDVSEANIGKEKSYGPKFSTLNLDSPEVMPYPHNTPYTNVHDYTGPSLSITSESDDNYSSSSEDD